MPDGPVSICYYEYCFRDWINCGWHIESPSLTNPLCAPVWRHPPAVDSVVSTTFTFPIVELSYLSGSYGPAGGVCKPLLHH
jgi:hypothetical protein